MIYPLNAFRKKSTTVKDTDFPSYEVAMWTTKPYCPKCGSNAKISIDHKIQEPIEGFDLVQDEPSKVSVVEAYFFRCNEDPDVCTGSRFRDPWLPFGTGGQKFSAQYYQYLLDTYLLEGLTIKEIKEKYFREISRPLADAVTNCRLAIGNYLDCRELWFIQTSYSGDERCIVLGLPADGDNNPVLLTICASPAEVATFRNKIDTEKIKAIACDCKFEYFYAIRDAFFLDPKISDVKVVFNSSMLKDAIDVAAVADRATLNKNCETDINEEIRKTKGRDKHQKEEKIQNKHYAQLGAMESVLDRLQAKTQAHFSNLINTGSTRKTLFQILEDSYYDFDTIEGTCAFIDFKKNFPSMFQVAHCINSIEIILKKQSGAKSVCKIATDIQATARKVKVIDQLKEFEDRKIPFDVAVLKLLFGDHTNFHRRLAENSAYAGFLKKCYEQRKTVEKGYHKMKLSLSDQMAFSSEGSNTIDPYKQISMTDFFSAMAPYRELEYYSAMLWLLKKNHAGDVHVTDPDIPEWEMIVAAVSEEITPWQYRAVWKDVHTVIPIDLEKI